MGTEMAVPFSIDSTGSVATTDDPAQQAINHIVSIIGTNLYQRIMNPLYGVDLDAMLFANNDGAVQSALIADISAAIATYEPGVQVENIVVLPDANEENALTVRVEFSLVTATGAAATTLTAVVTTAGGVVDVNG